MTSPFLSLQIPPDVQLRHGWEGLCMQLEIPLVTPSPAHRCKTCLCSADLKHRTNQPKHTICFLLLVNIGFNSHCQLRVTETQTQTQVHISDDFPKSFQRQIYSPNPRTCFTVCVRASIDALNLNVYRRLLALKDLKAHCWVLLSQLN